MKGETTFGLETIKFPADLVSEMVTFTESLGLAAKDGSILIAPKEIWLILTVKNVDIQWSWEKPFFGLLPPRSSCLDPLKSKRDPCSPSATRKSLLHRTTMTEHHLHLNEVPPNLFSLIPELSYSDLVVVTIDISWNELSKYWRQLCSEEFTISQMSCEGKKSCEGKNHLIIRKKGKVEIREVSEENFENILSIVRDSEIEEKLILRIEESFSREQGELLSSLLNEKFPTLSACFNNCSRYNITKDNIGSKFETKEHLWKEIEIRRK